VAAEEKKLEEARQQAVSDLRRVLAAETAEALRVQDEEIGLLIARLQVRRVFHWLV
jgi:ellis van creveld syndrome protein 1